MFTPQRNSGLVCMASALLLGVTGTAQASTVVANWDFNVASASDIGTTITTATDSVSGLIASQHPSNTVDAIYGAGTTADPLDGSADFSGGNGVLEVSDPTGILTGHNDGRDGATALTIDLDINMNTLSSSTWAIVRNGHIDGGIPGTAFNLFTQSDGAIGFLVYGSSGGSILGRTDLGNILDVNAGWQHITAAWDGTQVTIAVDGVPQVLNGLTGETFIAGDIGSMRASDANMGMGGLRRSGDPGSIGQFLDGSIDNLVVTAELPAPVIPGDINGDGFVGIDDLNVVLGNWNAGTPPAPGTPTIPEPATLGLMMLGGTALLRRRD